MSSLRPLLPFVVDETHLSWIARMAVFHTRGDVASFLSDLGLNRSKLMIGDEPEIRKLCKITGEDPGRVLSNTIQGSAAGATLAGISIGGTYRPQGEHAFCPACLAEDDRFAKNPGVARRERLIWALRFVRRCPVHGIRLILRRSDEPLSLQGLPGLVPDSQQSLEALAAALERRRPSGLQDYLVERLRSRTVGCLWLDEQQIEEVEAATERLGVLMRDGPVPSVDHVSEEDWEALGAIGWDWMRLGDDGLREALAESARRPRPDPAPPSFFGQFEIAMCWNRRKTPFNHVASVIKMFLSEMRGKPARTRDPFGPVKGRMFHTVETLSAATGLHPRDLVPALNKAGLFRETYHEFSFTGEDQPWTSDGTTFDGEAGLEVAFSVDGVELDELSRMLNWPRSRMDTVVGPILKLRSVRKIPTSLFPPHVGRKDAARLMAALNELPIEDDLPNGHRLVGEAADLLGESHATLLDVALASPSAGSIRLRKIPMLGGVAVDPEEIWARLHPRSHRSMTMVEVAELLEATPEAVEWLVRPGGGKPHLFRSRAHGLVRPADWRAFSARFADPGMIGSHLGVGRAEVTARLRAIGVPVVAAAADHGLTLYRRENVETYLPPLPRASSMRLG